MSAFKEATRFISKVVGGLAAAVFLFAPFTDSGWLAMAASVAVGLVCFGGYLWSEPDEPSDADSP
jgi:hypothetical protein